VKFASFFALGLLFAVGLGISGMTQPAKVLGFLDVFGTWDPALLFVMGSAVVVNAIGYRLTIRQASPIFGSRFDVPTRTDVDSQLVIGSALFGVGWGLAGFCPGPAIVAMAGGSPEVLVFVGSMFAGFVLKDLFVSPSTPMNLSDAASNAR
jgi:uncharacterized protein